MTVKKKASRRRSVRVKVETSDSMQSAAGRRAAEAQLRSLIAKFAPDRLRLVAAMRRSLRKRLPTAQELVYEYRSWIVISFSPTEKGYEGVLAIRADADGVQLYFNQGKSLPDPENLLKGSAQARFIEVESAPTLGRPAVETLVDEALARNRVPFAPAGRGSVVLRSASAKKRGRRRPIS